MHHLLHSHRLASAIRRATSTTALATLASVAWAAPIDTGNDDVVINWDNTLKYSAGARVKDRSSTLVDFVAPPAGGAAVSNTLNADDGSRNFKKGGLISNRLDLLSEFDLVYRRNAGLRIGAAAWYDDVYNRSNSNDSPATSNAPGVNNEFADGTRKLHGRKAELLDAFVFGSTDLGTTRLSGRLGRHTLLWGESLFFGNNGIAGVQAPVDVVKASSVPASTTKEVLMPVNQVSGTLQINNSLALMAYYQLEWRRSRLPGAGSYFSTSDLLDEGGDRIRLAPGGPSLRRGGDIEAKDGGQGGLAVKARFEEYDFGLYAVRFHAKTPAIYLHPAQGIYQLAYHEGVRAYGASASTSVGAVNYAAEVSVRRGTPLTTPPLSVPTTADNAGASSYAVGNSAHAQFSVLWTMPRFFISDEPNLSFEAAYNRMTSCERNCSPMAFNANRSTGSLDPNASRGAYGARVTFNAPQRGVLDGLDLTPGVSLAYYRGRSPVAVLGPDRGGDITFSLAANYLTVWDLSLAYTHYYGPTRTPAYASSNPQVNGTLSYGQALRDRNFVALSLRRTF